VVQRHPAQVFMGDVGALALGGALGTIAVIVRQEIVLAIMGGIFVVEALSVMIQVGWFKYTKKKYRRGPAHAADGAAAPPFREEGLGPRPRWWCASGSSPCCCAWSACPASSCADGRHREPCLDALSGDRLLVLGLGDSGLAMARWCVAQARPR
jgi:hypothetical protein